MSVASPPRSPAVRRLAIVGFAVLLAGTSGCTGPSASPQTPSPFAGCAALTAPPPAALPSPAAAGGSSSAAAPRAATASVDLPDLRLNCFTGGAPVALRDLHGPAVINLWASWCQPCRTELPVMQGLADRAGGRLTVLGVDTGDSREGGASFAAAKGVTMPTLFDPDRRLVNALARVNLPITIFVDPAGRRYVHLLPLDPVKLAALVRTHTGVAVPQ